MNFGRCSNLPSQCAKAASGELIEMPMPDSVCPEAECGKPLISTRSGTGPDNGKSDIWPKVMLGSIVALALAAGTWFMLSDKSPAEQKPEIVVERPEVTETPPPPPVSEQPERAVLPDYLVRLAGSNTVGGKLAPEIAAAYLASLGATDIKNVQRVDAAGKKIVERVVSGIVDGAIVGIEFKAHGSNTAIPALRNNAADIAMMSRPLKAEEISQLAPLGIASDVRSEHVLALDGIAVIVAQANPVQSLSKAQLTQIFTGEITDWSQVGVTGLGAISIYARDAQSGTFDTFRSIVLAGKELTSENVERFEKSEALDSAVAANPQGIGFVSKAYVKNARALAINDGPAVPLAPTNFTIRNLNYPLARKLFLYASANSTNPEVAKFINFALSDEGQKAVRASGFVDLIVPSQPISVATVDSRPCRLSDQWRGDANAYCKVRENPVIPVTFRFRPNSDELDTLAARDLRRVLAALETQNNARLILAGFADRIGDYTLNCRLSLRRAERIKGALATLGIKDVATQGFCEELPVGDDATEDGLALNRRVEIYSQSAP